MSSILRFLALLVLFLSMRTVSCMHIRSALDCIRDFFCVKTLDPSKIGEFCPQNKFLQIEGRNCEFELVGFMPTSKALIPQMEKETPAFQFGQRSTLLGTGVYVLDKFAAAEIDARQFFNQPAICAVYASKTEFLNSWSKIYVPRLLRETYLEELRKTDVVPEQNRSDRSPVLISQLQYIEGRNYVDGGYFMMIPESKARHLRIQCAHLNKREQTTGLNVDLKWEQKFIEEWKLSNFDKPMDILIEIVETGEKSLTSSKNWVTPAQKEQLEKSARNAA
ncbi:hypothetical protein BKA69DRAFT_1038860 [Paraphysoderma sedebokerense]|nr:hypothetical protein BKA69DRAFT_1038860 [Paraphysoderma sedebokerense]